MKKTIWYFISLLFPITVFAQQSPTGFTITGNAVNTGTDMVFLVYINAQNKEVKDTLRLKNEKLVAKGKVSAPVNAWLYSPNLKLNLHFWLENSAFNLYKAESGYTISGGKTQQEQLLLNKTLEPLNQKLKLLEPALRQAHKANDKEKTEPLEAQWQQLDEQKTSAIKQYITSAPVSFISLEQIAFLSTKKTVKPAELQVLFNSLDNMLTSSPRGKQLKELISNKTEAETGYNAPVFTLNNVAGKAVSLTDYWGKYVLVDFWASWCGPCREENPNVLKAYNAFHSKGLEILAVSLDSKREDWLRAIKEDNLPWEHVSDLKGWNSAVAKQYQLRGIPANLLVDPNGKMIATNLRGENLQKVLSDVFK